MNETRFLFGKPVVFRVTITIGYWKKIMCRYLDNKIYVFFKYVVNDKPNSKRNQWRRLWTNLLMTIETIPVSRQHSL